MDAEAIGQRVRERMAVLKLPQKDVATAAGISLTRVNDLANGRLVEKLALLTFDKLASALDTTSAYLLSGDPAYADRPLEPPRVHTKLDQIIAMLEPRSVGKPRELALIAPPAITTRQIQVPIRQQIAAGGGALSEPMIADFEWISVAADLKTPDSELVAHRIRGDSMEPALHDGDIIVVEYPRRQPAKRLLKEGAKVVVVTRGGGEEFENLVKEFTIEAGTGKEMLLSLNPEHGHIPLPKDIVYIGLVKLTIHK